MVTTPNQAPYRSQRFLSRARRTISGEGAYWVMVAPLLAFVVAIAIYPLIFSFRISLFKYRLTDPNQVQTFIGLENYVRAMQDPTVLSALQVTLVYVAGTVILEMVLGLGLALLLTSEVRTTRFVRSFLLIPMALPPLVVGLVWKSLYNADFGVIPYYLKQLGVDVGRGPPAGRTQLGHAGRDPDRHLAVDAVADDHLPGRSQKSAGGAV
jgi:multiple sugar transport system permease protein